MATTLFLRDLASTLGGAGQKAMLARRGRTAVTTTTNTVASGTNITITATAGGQVLSWFSEPVTNAVTISGTITLNIRCRESANTVNAGVALLIERANNAGTVQSTILADSTVPATIAEYTTTDAANGAATYTATSTAMAVGERIKITLKVRNVGTMAANATGVTNTYDGPAAAAAGDTYVTFATDFRADEVLDVPAFEVWGRNAYYG